MYKQKNKKVHTILPLNKQHIMEQGHKTESVKPQNIRHTLRRYYYMEQRYGHILRKTKAKYKQLR
jgi:hypothetical protein